jgi:hypothetical protein
MQRPLIKRIRNTAATPTDLRGVLTLAAVSFSLGVALPAFGCYRMLLDEATTSQQLRLIASGNCLWLSTFRDRKNKRHSPQRMPFVQ